MNPDNPATPSEPPITELNLVPPGPSAISWVKRFLWRNPFYLASAALFLFGINQLSLDPSFFASEERKLLFNFSALQGYEILLVLIALFLAARRIWYDSTLLVVLESGFVLVQFILISHAALIGSGMAWGVCIVGTLLAIGRFGSLKRWFPQLNLPAGLLACGGLVLLANLCLPFYFRWTLEDATPDWDDLSARFWLWALPALQLMANMLPKANHAGRLDSQRSWLPFLIFHLWIAATAVHLRCLDYFSTVPFQPWLLVPLLWTLAWTTYARFEDFAREAASRVRSATLVAPALVSLLATTGPDSRVFFVLMALNALAFAGIALLGRHRRVSLELLLASCAALCAGFPEVWGHAFWADFERGRCVAASLAGYAAIRAAFSLRPLSGWVGALAVALGLVFLRGIPALGVAVQAGFLFFLAHSLRWPDGEVTSTRVLRGLVAFLWVGHSYGWTFSSGSLAGWAVASTGVSLLALYCLSIWLSRQTGPLILPVVSVMSMSAPPLEWVLTVVQRAPSGVMAVVVSLLLLALGTVFALIKHRWNEPSPLSSHELNS